MATGEQSSHAERLRNPRAISRYVATVALYLLPVLAALVFFYLRGLRLYAPPDFGGFEPAFNHFAGIEITETGVTTMTYHPTGYAYVTGLIYLLLPNVPFSVIAVQVASLPWLVHLVRRLFGALGGPTAARWGLVVAALYYPFAYYSVVYNSTYFSFLFTTWAMVLVTDLLGARRSWGRIVGAGLLLGAVVCMRAHFGVLGLFFFGAIWAARRSFKEALVRAVPMGAVCCGLLLTMVAFNPPEPGQFTRGSHPLSRSLLEATYQYERSWWDWEWTIGEDKAFLAEVQRIEAITGKPYTDPATQPLVRDVAWERITGKPLNQLKKIAISTVRVWVLVPTHLQSRGIKVVIACQELLLLGLAVAGLVLVRRNRGVFVLCLGAMALPTVMHWFLHVEPRYSLPCKVVELGLATISARALYARLRGTKRFLRADVGPGTLPA